MSEMIDCPAGLEAIAATDVALLVVDGDGVVVVCNPAAETLLGISSADVVGDFVEALLPPDKRWSHQSYRSAYLAAPEERLMDPGLQPELQFADGTTVPVEVRLRPLVLDQVTFVVAEISVR